MAFVTDFCQSTGAAVSLGTGSDVVIDTQWVMDLAGDDWTIALWLDRTASSSTSVQYVFGDPTSLSLRGFLGGVAGADGFMLRGGGLPDVLIPGGGDTSQAVHVAWTHDGLAGEVRGYLGGQLAATTVLGSPLSLSGTNPFAVMQQLPGNPVDLGVIVDDFRIYRRSLQATELAALATCGSNNNYCTAIVNSLGQPATISAQGSLSVSAQSLTLVAAPVPNQPGLFYYGPDQVQFPFGNGFRCVGGTVFRLPVTSALNQVLAHDVDFTVWPASLIAAGEVWNFQGWYRDPAAGGAAFNLSDGIELTFQP